MKSLLGVFEETAMGACRLYKETARPGGGIEVFVASFVALQVSENPPQYMLSQNVLNGSWGRGDVYEDKVFRLMWCPVESGPKMARLVTEAEAMEIRDRYVAKRIEEGYETTARDAESALRDRYEMAFLWEPGSPLFGPSC